MYRQIRACRICNNGQLVEVLDLGNQALTGVFPSSRSQPVTSGPLKLVKCEGGEKVCGLVQLLHTYDLSELYGDNYGYRSGLNASMVAHLREKVRKILARVKLPPGALVIDIGANDSTTLQAYPTSGCDLVGIDPTGKKFRQFYPPHIQLIPDFFSAAVVRQHLGDRRASVITSFSMFYDLEEPVRFAQEVHDTLHDEGIWVFEQSYMPTMLARNSYDTVCHEHLEYYALKQIKWITDRVGLRIIDVEFNDVNGGSFSVVAARAGSSHVTSPQVEKILREERQQGLDTLQPYRAFAERVAVSRDNLRSFIARARQEGRRVGALGASTKGNVVLQYCELTEADVEGVGEVNPDKFGCYTPGSLIPIVAEDELLATKPDYLLVLPWHFRKYFEASAKLAGRHLVFPLPVIEVS
jgi:C-methyltransferase C-terminal domain/Putative zinc binding domain/Methyltransferase domain